MSKKGTDAESEQTAAYNKAMGISSNTKSTIDNNIKNPGLTPDDRIESERVEEENPLQAKLNSLSATNRIDEMKNKLENDFYVFDGVALGGETTLFFAWPSTGKTLLFMHLLIEGIRAGAVDPKKAYYINADDNFRGLVTKAEIAEEHGFYMISPYDSDMEPAEIIQLLIDVATNENPGKMVVILDTVKKFVNLMSKVDQSKFYTDLRKLTAKGVAVILAGHANKYASADGELICEGTADSSNDIDCVYSINRLVPLHSDEMTVECINTKSRGSVLNKRSFKYDNRKDTSWPDRLASVELLDEKTAGAVKHEKIIQDKMDKYASQLLFVSALLETRSMNQSEILKRYAEHKSDSESKLHPLAAELSRRELQTGLEKLTNISWRVTRDTEHNAKLYTLIDKSGDRYKKAKNGE